MTTSVMVQSLPGQGYRHQMQVGRHTVFLDVPQDKGGTDTAPSPHDFLLGALGACTAMTMEMYAKRKNWDLQAVSVKVTETQVKPDPAATRTIPQLAKQIEVRGNLSEEQLSTLKSIAEKCPVNKIITGEKSVTSTLNLVG
jgi:putative redox protein